MRSIALACAALAAATATVQAEPLYDRFCLAELLTTGALKTAPVRLLSSLLEAGPNLRLEIAVEPGREFRLLSSTTLTGWAPVSTNRTARRSHVLTQPAATSRDFFQIEQAFEAP